MLLERLLGYLFYFYFIPKEIKLMKIPSNPNYKLMKLPYSNSEFPSHLTSDPVIPKGLFTKNPLFPYDYESVYILWPSSWNYPDSLLRDAFSVLACFPDQAHTTYVALSKKIQSDIKKLVLKKEKDFEDSMMTQEYFEYLLWLEDSYTEKEKKTKSLLEKIKTSFVMPYSFHVFRKVNESIEVPFFFRHDAFTQESQGPEIYCLSEETFYKIKAREYDFETRILEKFQYFPGLYGNFLAIATTDMEQNRKQNDNRTEQVEEKEEKRVTPMKALW